MKAIVIKRPLSDEEYSHILALSKEGSIEIYGSAELPAGIAGLNKGAFVIDEGLRKKINYETMDTINSFGDEEFDGKAIVDWLQFDESSMWYYHKFRAYFRLRDIKYELAALSKLSETFESVTVYTSDTILNRSELTDNIKMVYAGSPSPTGRKYISLFNYTLILCCRFFLNMLVSNNRRKAEHIIMDVTKRQIVLDIDTLKISKDNYVIGYLLKKAGKNFLIMDESVQPKMSDGARISLSRDHLCGKGSRKGRYFGEPMLLNYFLSPALRKKKKHLETRIKHALQALGDLCRDEDDSLIIDIFKDLKGASGFYLIKYLVYKRFFSKNSFRTISTVDENSPALRAILDAARINGVKTIGIQHGNIHDLHPAYMFTKKDAIRKAQTDITLVWSDFWKKFLIENGNYPEDSLIVSGQIRTDIIPGLMKANFKKEDVIPGVSSNEKLIVFASQPQGDADLRERAAIDTMQAVKDIPDAFLLIKLHPNEKNDFEYYASLAKRIGLEKTEISLEIELYLLISVCDMLITCYSTVGTETIYFNKPLLILDYLKQDMQNFHKEGVAFQLTNSQELKDTITGLYADTFRIDDDAYNRFVIKYAHALDGKATERSLAEISS